MALHRSLYRYLAGLLVALIATVAIAQPPQNDPSAEEKNLTQPLPEGEEFVGGTLPEGEEPVGQPANPEGQDLASAQARTPVAVRLIRVSLPITDSVDAQVKRAVNRALAELPRDGGRPLLVFEFDPPRGKNGEGTEFGRALDLARFLSSREMSVAKTLAFIPRTIKGHGVLAAMACEELVMAKNAEIGEAGLDEKAEEAIDPTVRSGYAQIAGRRLTIPTAVAIGMLDRQAEVLKVETETGPEIVLRSELPELERKHTIQSEQVIKPAGQLGLFTGSAARELGLVTFLASDKAALAKALGVPASALEDDPTLGGQWHAIRLPIKGAINSQNVAQWTKILQTKLRDGEVNFVCVSIDSPGGSLVDSLTLADAIADLDPSKVRSVAYITGEADGDAALIALACDQIVMQRDATLGGSGAEAFSPEQLVALRDSLKNHLSVKKSKPWSLMDVLVDGEIPVYRYEQKKTGLIQYFSEEEAKSQPDADEWVQGEALHQGREPLQADAARAEQLGLARHSVRDLAEFKRLYKLEDEMALAEPSWAHNLIDALAMPAVAYLLLFVGIAALYAELHSPGIGAGAFIAGVCFLLFFWSKYLDGTADWLEALLFLAGVVCILLEIFVLPGVAIFGLGGGLMIISSLILASQTFVVPHNEYQFRQFRDTLVGLSAVTVGFLIAAIAMRRFLPESHLFSQVMLAPPSGDELDDLNRRESFVNLNPLLGRQGQTTTQLVPAGKARFDGQLADVTSQGEFIDRGTTVVVIEVAGNRVVVRPVS